jgi:hypothetical protein
MLLLLPLLHLYEASPLFALKARQWLDLSTLLAEAKQLIASTLALQ